MSPKKVVEKFKIAASEGSPPPSSLVVLLRRCISSKYAKYQRYYGIDEPHLFTYPASTRLSITGPDLKKLLMGGLTRIQCNEPNEVTFYFGPTKEDQERIQVPSIDFFALGQEAARKGLKRVPVQDLALMAALKEVGPQPLGSGITLKALKRWEDGWNRIDQGFDT